MLHRRRNPFIYTIPVCTESKYDNVLKEAETEAEVIKKNKLLEVKEKFLNKKQILKRGSIAESEDSAGGKQTETTRNGS